MKVSIVQAKNQLSQLVRSVQAGDEVVIANRGEPVARLVSATKTGEEKSSPGNARQILGWLSGHPLPSYARRSAEEIDGAIAEERESWG